MVLVDTFYCLDGDVSSRIKSYSGQTHVNVPFWSTVALHENRENVVRAHTDFVRAGKGAFFSLDTHLSVEF